MDGDPRFQASVKHCGKQSGEGADQLGDERRRNLWRERGSERWFKLQYQALDQSREKLGVEAAVERGCYAAAQGRFQRDGEANAGGSGEEAGSLGRQGQSGEGQVGE